MTESISYPRIVRAISETPWAILPDKLADIMALVALRASGERLTADEIAEQLGAASRPMRPRSTGEVAVLPLVGTISHRMGLMAQSSGGTSTQAFAQQFRQAIADPSIAHVIIDIDSPGGSVSGVDELTSEIYRARGSKPVTAVANALAASAAYWIGTAADELVVTPSGSVGSIGVIAAHQDESKFQERLGVKTSLITAGKYKGENNPFEPLSDEGRAAIQARVDESYGMFVRAVARNRGVSADTVRSEFGEGRMVGAREAVRRGMADRVETIDDVIAQALRGARRGARDLAAESAPPTMTLVDQSEAVLTAARLFQTRLAALTSMRVEQGRTPLAEANVERIDEHISAYEGLIASYRAWRNGTRADDTSAQAVAVLAEYLALEARRLGVAV